MKFNDRLGLFIFATAVVLSLGIVIPPIDHLPLRMATHFNADGHADGWMDQTRFRVTFIAMMVALPLFILLIAMVTRYLPDPFLNLPHRDFWLSPGRRDKTFAVIRDFGMTAAGATLWLLAMLYQEVVRVNEVAGRPFAPSWQTFTFPILILGVGLLRLMLKFHRPPLSSAGR